MEKEKQNSLMTKAAIVLMILILPFNIIGIITSVLSYRASLKNTETAISHTLDSYGLLLDNRIRNTNSVLYELTNNNSLLLNMRHSSDESQYRILRYQFFSSFNDQIKTTEVAQSWFFYQTDRDDYIPVPAYTGFTAGSRPWISYIDNYSPEYARWFMSDDHSSLLRILYDNSLHLYCGAVIDLQAFLSDLNGIFDFSSMEYFFEDTEPDKMSGKLLISHKTAANVWLCASVSTRDISGSIGILQYALILFFILYLALIPLLFFLMQKYMGKPLRILNQAHEQLQEGNEDFRIQTAANSSEFSEAYESFNEMASSLQTLQKEILEKELANKQLQIDYLQLQIRPHFLLNSFNVLYTLIQRGQKEPSQEMVLFLSDYFRYLFRSGSELQLFSKEKKLIEDYMNITRISYPVSFEVSYQLDPQLDLIRVPPLLLHSFMENIIAHALLPDRCVHIVFSGEYDDGLATFYISDDGKGMEPEAIDAINHITDIPIDDGRNVGIKNSIYRLKYYYGEAASVVCDSEINIGTTFTITIPYNLEEE